MKIRKAAARFFVRIGQAGRAAAPRDEFTAPLFPLWLIMDAEGLLSKQANESLVPKGHGQEAGRGDLSHNGEAVAAAAASPAPLSAADRRYLARCAEALRGVSLDLGAA